MREQPLEPRFLQNLRSLGFGDQPKHLLVALSGGLDSTVLLHLLRFRTPLPIRVSAAHLDHRMRPESRSDAEWVGELCRTWEVELHLRSVEVQLRGEEDARRFRYTYLFETAERVGAEAIATAHHADDQAETVLFRILRGTGLAGLAGIPRRTRAGLVRPLLPFWREELEEYAQANGLEWRTDASNATLGPVRNRLRLRILPVIEREISPRARRHLVALAELARESEAGWRSIVAEARRELVRRDGGALILARSRLRGYDRPVAARLVRDLLARFEIVPSRAGTSMVLQFITDAPSGREMQLAGGVQIRLEFDDARIERRPAPPEEDEPFVIGEMGAGATVSGPLRIGGRTYRVEACHGGRSDERLGRGAIWRARIPVAALRFPLLLRGRQPGDRVRTPGGSKPLKKLMIERRVPGSERAHRPVLVDAEGAILWVAGVVTEAPGIDPAGVVLNLAIHAG